MTTAWPYSFISSKVAYNGNDESYGKPYPYLIEIKFQTAEILMLEIYVNNGYV